LPGKSGYAAAIDKRRPDKLLFLLMAMQLYRKSPQNTFRQQCKPSKVAKIQPQKTAKK
jgi:hypothetical protein